MSMRGETGEAFSLSPRSGEREAQRKTPLDVFRSRIIFIAIPLRRRSVS
jgi:hypothetical protein